MLVCPGGELELRVLEDGVLGVAVDGKTSVHGPLTPGATLGAIPFIWDGMLHVRALRNGLPDRILTTGIPAQIVPATRHSGIILQGALGWGVECFRLGGPGLWQAPDPFHLVSTDSGARLGVPPVLVWRHSMDPDTWGGVRYSVHWAPTPDYSPGTTTIVECGADTSRMFPSGGFGQGSTIYWKVVATDGTGLTRESSETLWWCRADTLNAHPALPVLAVSPPWPNPCTGTVTLRLSLMPDESVRVALHDVSGRLVATQSLAASRDLRWAVPPAVPAGVYALSVRSGALRARFRFVLDR